MMVFQYKNHYSAIKRMNYWHNNMDKSQNHYAEWKKPGQNKEYCSGLVRSCKILENAN